MSNWWSTIKRFFTGETSISNEIKSVTVERLAIDQSGKLGSLYETSTDTFTGKLCGDFKSNKSDSKEPIACWLFEGRTCETQNLLNLIGADPQLRLSIISKIVQPTGIASIINHHQSIDKNTRILYFRYETQVESCQNDLFRKVETRILEKLDTSTTCILGRITYGIHAVIILQLPADRQDDIHRLLDQIRQDLLDRKHMIEMSSENRDLLKCIISTTVYSNISTLNQLNNLYDICQRIQQLKKKLKEQRVLKHTFFFIQVLNPDSSNEEDNYKPDDRVLGGLENQLLERFNEIKTLQTRIDYELPELLQDKLEERLKNLKESLAVIREVYDNTLKEISEQIKLFRKGGKDVQNVIEELMKGEVWTTITDSIWRLNSALEDLKTKGEFIKQLQNDGYEYCDVTKLGIDGNDNEQMVKDKLLENNPNKTIVCFTDQLKQQSSQEYNRLYPKITETRESHSQSPVIYADFSYTKCSLQKMETLSPRQTSIQSTSSQRKRQAPGAPNTSEDNIVNILLIGESGVGKSTFINAFANYLKFDSLKQAESGQPTVIIPVSFLMTTNDDFDEQLVKFGEPDPNENHMNTGQSVTQQCRSYVFDVSYERKLRIIDTPGFGDTRGSDQDESNMQIIFSYLNNITYLHGICLLFKPNVQQLHRFLSSCFTQLFRYFGNDIRKHLIFCFTNARSTFFTPGDTRPLLQSLLDSLPVKDIPFSKENIFCFDSESFRYLVALQQSLTFKEIQRDEFDKSWERSVEESKRFRSFLCNDLEVYDRNVEWKSIEDAQWQIDLVTRPVLEGLRNILRNIILHDSNCYIKLHAASVDRSMIINYSIDRSLEHCGEFWIFSDHLVPISTEVRFTDIQHNSNEQNRTEYRLNYKFCQNSTNETTDSLRDQWKTLCNMCATFAHFLMTTRARTDDPFMMGLNRMIQEEQFICKKYHQNKPNQQLATNLERFKNEYEQLIKDLNAHNSDDNLSTMYDLLRSLDKIWMVKIQINAIKTYQKHFLTSNEQNISEQSIRL